MLCTNAHDNSPSAISPEIADCSTKYRGGQIADAVLMENAMSDIARLYWTSGYARASRRL
jgi:hypothetical protein